MRPRKSEPPPTEGPRNHDLGSLLVRIEGQREETERLLRALVRRNDSPEEADIRRLRALVRRNHRVEASLYALCDASGETEGLIAMVRRQHDDLESRLDSLVEKPSPAGMKDLADRIVTHSRFEDREVFPQLLQGYGRS